MLAVLVNVDEKDSFKGKILQLFSGSVAVKYAVAMGMRVVTVVAPNDKVIERDAFGEREREKKRTVFFFFDS